MIAVLLIIVTVAVGAFFILSGQMAKLNTISEQSSTPIAPLLPNAAVYQCPPWMDEKTCALMKKSCGNGVCDPHEQCNTCVIDCGCGGALLCNPEIGKCYSPAVEDVDMIAGVCPAPLGNN
ncbi:MAG: hypothetical protein HYY67_02250 [Thaumarchaeota archaeon]|nr:hypothetical protein [Nitrososphaerota archaeon]